MSTTQNINKGVYDGDNEIKIKVEGLTSFFYWYKLVFGGLAISDKAYAKR